MALSYQQIITLACQIAKCPRYTSQAGQLIAAILDELIEDYDFDIARGSTNFNFDTAATGPLGYAPGSGPNLMPADFLRVRNDNPEADDSGAFYMISGVPYPMTAVVQTEFDAFVQQAGLNSFPRWYYIDLSTDPAGMYVWPPPSGAYPVTVRYQRKMPTPAEPESSAEIPWFPNTNYLITRTAGELMRITNDNRAEAFLGDSDDRTPLGAGVILRKYLKMKDDPTGKVKRVTLDPARFRPNFNRLPNTKQIGW